MREDQVVDLSDFTQVTTSAQTRVRYRVLTSTGIPLLCIFFDILSPHKLCDELHV